ncbi:MAG TPA: Hsp33 family molecular chaperone HslO [Candidatus Didemnitutus sp.]|nr:Hsp33 family molecular chaperone HslO [Candidatus Didemnitutus sp.]
MAESSSSFAPILSDTLVTVSFVRNRNALLMRGDLGTLFVDYMLHVSDNRLNYSEEAGRLLKEGLAAFVLHCASRPRMEHIAWTVNLQKPLLNLFLAGDNEDCLVTGRVFTEEVRRGSENLFYSDIVPRRGEPTRRSIVKFEGAAMFAAAEAYYEGSEQRLARYFELGGDDFALLISHPDCDLEWLRRATADTVRNLHEQETVTLIERRKYHWECGCTQEKIMRVVAQACHGDAQTMFEGEETLRAQCPRCGAVYTITREAMEAFLAESK